MTVEPEIPSAKTPKTRTMVLYDATRLFMRASGASPTGIDRVNEAYARWLLARDDIDLIPVCSWTVNIAALSLGVFKSILNRKARQAVASSAAWPALEAALSDPSLRRPGLRVDPAQSAFSAGWLSRANVAWRYVTARLRTVVHSRPWPNTAGALYVNVSHYGLEQRGLLERLTARGVRPVVMIHDLIPIQHPEYCSPLAFGWHRDRVDAVLRHADLVITNSASTADDLAAYAAEKTLRTPPMCVAPLGLEAQFLAPRGEPLRAPPYFLCVGTIEPRKNLTFLLTVWRRLAGRLGDATPYLVLAGQRGWENESVIDQLERAPAIKRFVHEVSGLTDGELARLIGGARALLSPSFSEGFNLPVAEALAMGTPVIASDIPVHRELAGGATLVDPLDGLGWLEAVEAAIREPSANRPHRLPGWPEHFARVAQAMGLDQ